MRSWIGRTNRPALRLGNASILQGNRSLDVGPYPMNWEDIQVEELSAQSERLQVAGINVPVIFSANAPTGMTAGVYINGTDADEGATFTALGTSPTQFSVSPNCFVWFDFSSFDIASGTVTVRNVTAANAVIDSFLVSLGIGPPP